MNEKPFFRHLEDDGEERNQLTVVTDNEFAAGRYLIRIRSGRWGDGPLLTNVTVRSAVSNTTLAYTDGPQTEVEAIRNVLLMIKEHQEDLEKVIRALFDWRISGGGE